MISHLQERSLHAGQTEQSVEQLQDHARSTHATPQVSNSSEISVGGRHLESGSAREALLGCGRVSPGLLQARTRKGQGINGVLAVAGPPIRSSAATRVSTATPTSSTRFFPSVRDLQHPFHSSNRLDVLPIVEFSLDGRLTDEEAVEAIKAEPPMSGEALTAAVLLSEHRVRFPLTFFSRPLTCRTETNRACWCWTGRR